MKKGKVKDVKVIEKSRFLKIGNSKIAYIYPVITKCAGIYYNMYTYTIIYTYVSMSEV